MLYLLSYSRRELLQAGLTDDGQESWEIGHLLSAGVLAAAYRSKQALHQ